MGYEIKLIAVRKSNMRDKDFGWSEKIAEINLCKLDYDGIFHSKLPKMRKTKYFFYADDGNTEVIYDKYGECLKEINIKPLIKILNKEKLNWRIYSSIKFLKSLPENIDLTVLIYGY